MLIVDWPQLGTIVITALVRAFVGYVVHWLQTVQQRKWQKQEEQRTLKKLKLEGKQKAIYQYIQKQQLLFERIANLSDRYKVFEMSKGDLRSEFVPIAQELAELNAESVWLDLPEDPELMRLNQKLEEETESLKEYARFLRGATLNDDTDQKTTEILKEKSQAFAKIGKQINQRFEELKAQIK